MFKRPRIQPREAPRGPDRASGPPSPWHPARRGREPGPRARATAPARATRSRRS